MRLDSLRLFVNSTRRCALTEKNSVWLHSHRPSFASSRRSVRFVVSLASRYLLSLNSSSFRFVSLCRKLRIFATLPPLLIKTKGVLLRCYGCLGVHVRTNAYQKFQLRYCSVYRTYRHPSHYRSPVCAERNSYTTNRISKH